MFICMLDLETLDLTPTAQVLSIGAFKFDPRAPLEVASELAFKTIHAEQCYETKLTEQPHRTIGYGTVQWWMKQSEEARKRTFGLPKNWVEILTVDFPAWYAAAPQPSECYSFPGTFDLPILQNMYEQLGRESPINYYEWRDLRTLAAASGVDRKSVKVPSWIVEHSALHDCVKQALWVQACYSRLS